MKEVGLITSVHPQKCIIWCLIAELYIMNPYNYSCCSLSNFSRFLSMFWLLTCNYDWIYELKMLRIPSAMNDIYGWWFGPNFLCKKLSFCLLAFDSWLSAWESSKTLFKFSLKLSDLLNSLIYFIQSQNDRIDLTFKEFDILCKLNFDFLNLLKLLFLKLIVEYKY